MELYSTVLKYGCYPDVVWIINWIMDPLTYTDEFDRPNVVRI